MASAKWRPFCLGLNVLNHSGQGWGEYYSGTRLAQNDKHEYTKNIVLEYYLSTDFPVLVLVCGVLAPALILAYRGHMVTEVLVDIGSGNGLVPMAPNH